MRADPNISLAAKKPKDDGKYEIEAGSQEEADIIARLETSYQSSRQNQQLYRKRWAIIDRFLLGYQVNGGSGETAGRMTTPDNDTPYDDLGVNDINEQVYVNNKLLEAHREDMARFTRYNPNISVNPNNPNSEKDKKAARVARIVLYDLMEKQKFDTRIKIRAARIITTKGCVALKVCFNPKGGNKVMWPCLDENGDLKQEVKMNPDTGEETLEPVYEQGPEGCVEWDVVSPQNLTFPRGTVDLANAAWVQETNVRSTAWVLENFGVEVKSENVTQEESYYFPDREERAEELGDPETKNTVVKERYYRPCPEFPKGAIFIWAGKVLLRSSTVEDYYPGMMYFWANNIMNENYILGDTPYWHALADQVVLNQLDSITMRYSMIWGNIKLLVPTESTIEEEDWTNEADQVMQYAGKDAPQFIRPPDLPMTLQNFRAQVLDNLRSKVAIRDRARRAASGNVIAYEQDQDDSTIAPALQELEQMYEDAMQFSLVLMAENYALPRLVRMTGSTVRGVVEDFVGPMLAGNFDAKCSLMSGLPANKYARQQYLLSMYKMQALNKQELLQYSEFPDIEKVFEEANKDRENVEDFLERMEKNEPVPIKDFYNLPMLFERLRLLMGERYWDWPKEMQAIAEQTFQDVKARIEAKAIEASMAKSMRPGELAPPGAEPTAFFEEAGGATSSQADGGQPPADSQVPLGPGSFQNV